MPDFVYSVVTGSASVIGSQRTISFNLNTGGDQGNTETDVVTGLKYITGAACTNNQNPSKGFKVVLNDNKGTPTNGTATLTGAASGSEGVLTVFGYGGG